MERLLSRICDPWRLEAILGDLEEIFEEKKLAHGVRRARLTYMLSAIGFLRPSVWKKFSFRKTNPTIMFNNYVKIFWRNLRRRPVFSILNLSCLSLGIAAALLILLYLDFELNYDRIHERADHIYRIETKAINTRQRVIDVEWQGTPARLGPLIEQDYPEVEGSVRFYNFYNNERPAFRYHGKTVEEEEVWVADAAALEVFNFSIIKGDPSTALQGPGKIMLSQDLAERIFGLQDPIGQILETDLSHRSLNEEETYAFEVTAVFQNLPRNTSIYTHALLSADTDPYKDRYGFGEFFVTTYLLLNSEADPLAFEPKMTEIYDKYLETEDDQILVNASHQLVALPKIHFSDTNGRMYIYIFSVVGVLLLIISFISYVNMVTAQGTKRALEIGVRKVMGSQRKQLIGQFLTESLFYTLVALSFAILLVVGFIKPINTVLDLNLSAEKLGQTWLVIGMLSIVIMLGIIGGSYPAFFLSSFKPIAVLKGRLVKPAPLRRFLVAFQFAVVIFVLSCTAMIYQQLEYLRDKDLGFDQDRRVQLTLSGQEAQRKWPVLKQSLLASPDILSIGTSNFIPGVGGMVRGPVSVEGSEPVFVRRALIDNDYFDAMNVQLVKGRTFSPDFPSDSSRAVIINQALVDFFELGEEPLGKKIKLGDWGNPNYLEIIGVVEDFHQSSLHDPIVPQLFRWTRASTNVAIQLGPDIRSGMRTIEKTWSEVFPGARFEYAFLDGMLSERYEADQRRGRIFFYFSILTVFIAFVGLFGLTSYLAAQRTKEMGIRKVFGAGLKDIVLLLSKDFLWLVALSALPGLILAWLVIRRWLENFAYQAGMNYWLFGLVLILVLVLTILTVGWHAIRTARLNPKDTLKYE